ncbi:hypothetical protein Tco_0369328 [Tanacetum coccineum]
MQEQTQDPDFRFRVDEQEIETMPKSLFYASKTRICKLSNAASTKMDICSRRHHRNTMSRLKLKYRNQGVSAFKRFWLAIEDSLSVVRLVIAFHLQYSMNLAVDITPAVSTSVSSVDPNSVFADESTLPPRDKMDFEKQEGCQRNRCPEQSEVGCTGTPTRGGLVYMNEKSLDVKSAFLYGEIEEEFKKIFKYLKVANQNWHVVYPKISPLSFGSQHLRRKKLENSALCCASKQLKWLTSPPTEAEYVAALAAVTLPATIWPCEEPSHHQRTKHIEIRHHFIRDANEKNLIQVLKIHTDDNVADLLTKAFDGPRFAHTAGYLYHIPIRQDGFLSAGCTMVRAGSISYLLNEWCFFLAVGLCSAGINFPARRLVFLLAGVLCIQQRPQPLHLHTSPFFTPVRESTPIGSLRQNGKPNPVSPVLTWRPLPSAPAPRPPTHRSRTDFDFEGAHKDLALSPKPS